MSFSRLQRDAEPQSKAGPIFPALDQGIEQLFHLARRQPTILRVAPRLLPEANHCGNRERRIGFLDHAASEPLHEHRFSGSWVPGDDGDAIHPQAHLARLDPGATPVALQLVPRGSFLGSNGNHVAWFELSKGEIDPRVVERKVWNARDRALDPAPDGRLAHLAWPDPGQEIDGRCRPPEPRSRRSPEIFSS